MDNKSIRYFIGKYVKNYDSVSDILSNKDKIHINDDYIKNEFNKSTQGYIYEKLWDICIKFGVTDLTNANTEHGFGNINDKTKSSFHHLKIYIDKYIKSLYISGNSGGYSDITFKDPHTQTLNLASVKYYENEKDIKSYDIQNICTIIRDRTDDYDNINMYLFVKNKTEFVKKIEKSNRSSNILIKYISPCGNYENVLDETDLERYYIKVKSLLEMYNYLETDESLANFKTIYLKQYKKIFEPRFHQNLFIHKINHLINQKNTKIMVGAIPRSGKTFIMAGTILEYVKNNIDKSNRFVIITPAPSETISQYIEVFNEYVDFDNLKIKAIEVKGDIQKIKQSDESSNLVYVVSKQRLGYAETNESKIANNDEKKMKKIEENIEKYFDNNKFNIIFLDEAHFGMTTKNAETILNLLDKHNTPKVFVTATYNKPNIKYSISENQRISWDINDIKILKQLNEKNYSEMFDRFSQKFGKNILNKILKKYGTDINQRFIIISNEYKNNPEPFLITSVWDKEFLETEKSKTTDSLYSFDMDKLFTPKKDTVDKFENEEHMIELLHYYFGYPNKNLNYNDQLFYKQRGIMPRISNICNNNCRTLQYPSHKTSQLWFLPYGTGREIKKVINALLNLLNNHFPKIFERYSFYVAIEKMKNAFEPDNVSYMTNRKNIKNEIKEIENSLRNKEGLIILAGARLQLGISLSNVDIVTLFTNISSSDTIYQMMFRSMTEIDTNFECDGENFCGRKKYGFMVDLNPQRTLFTINTLTEQLIDDSEQDQKNIYNIIADLINIDRDVLKSKYDDVSGVNTKFSDELFERMYSSWVSKVDNIKKIVQEFEYDTRILEQLKDVNMSRSFKLSQDRKTILTDNNPDNEVNGSKITLQQLFKNVNKKKRGKEVNIKEIIDIIITEVISLLTTVTSYTDLECKMHECIFDQNKDFKFIKYKFIELLEHVDKNEILRDIFISSLKDIIIEEGLVHDDELFNMIKIIASIIKEKKSETKSTKSTKSSGGSIINLNKIILSKKKQLYNIKQPDKLLEFIHNNLAPKEVEKKERGEVFTPMKLVNEMLDKLPKSVWKNKDLKWLDPAAGIGNFPVGIYIRLMEGLKNEIPGEEQRRKHILENMIYMVEINKKNVYLMKKILCGVNYKLNVFNGSFIETTENVKVFNSSFKFDIVVGNPPYQTVTGKSTTTAIWDKFIVKSLNILLISGYLLFVNPSGWRDVDGDFKKIQNEIFSKNLIYLEIHNEKDGIKTFNAETRYDIILVQNSSVSKTNTKILFEDKDTKVINVKILDFIPNGQYDNIMKMIDDKKEKRINLLYDSCSYHTQKKWVNGKKTNIFKYPCVYTVNSKGEPKFKYSSIKYVKEIQNIAKKCLSKNVEHFSNKLIWSNGRISSVGSYIDESKYALTQYSYAIVENDIDTLKMIKKAFDTPEFRKMMEYCAVSQLSINYKVLALFKKDFYKHFV